MLCVRYIQGTRPLRVCRNTHMGFQQVVPAYEDEEDESGSHGDEAVKVNEMRASVSNVAIKFKTSDR